MLKKLKREKGSVTVEATISLTIFMFAIVTVLSIINICLVQARVAHAINTTAKELSQYSYLYSLTGFAKSEAELAEAAKNDTEDIGKILEDVNTVFNEIENLGDTASQTPENVDDITAAWDSAVGSAENIQAAGSSLENTIGDIAKDPKGLMFGIAKLAASNTLELGKSRLIAAPLSKVMCKKHLVDTKDGDAESYLKSLGVVPAANGSYMDGLDFSKSTLFPYGSNEITVNVEYDVKVITLLPIDFTFHFNQTAITHGWLSGDKTYKSSTQYKETDSTWTKATVKERSSIIRNLVMKDLALEGYEKTTGLTDVQMYNKEKNEFVMISSMNPLYSPEGEETKTLADLSDKALKDSIELLCGKINSTTDGLTEITTKSTVNGSTTKTTSDCTNASNKIMLVIPEDPGLKEKIEEIIAQCDTKGVTIEVVPSFGNGANQTVVTEEEKES